MVVVEGNVHQLLCMFASEKEQVEEERKITGRSAIVIAVSLAHREIMKTADFISAV